MAVPPIAVIIDFRGKFFLYIRHGDETTRYMFLYRYIRKDQRYTCRKGQFPGSPSFILGFSGNVLKVFSDQADKG